MADGAALGEEGPHPGLPGDRRAGPVLTATRLATGWQAGAPGLGLLADQAGPALLVVEAGAKVVASTVRGPAIIGGGTRIENSYVGPFTSIHDDVTITGSEIEHSIILDHSRIADIGGRLEDSLIGKNVEVFRSDGKPKTYRLMLGDSSQVGLV